MLHTPQPTQHPDRALLHNEIHARPPEALTAPLAITHVVMLADAEGRAASRAHLATLLRDHHLAPPDAQTTHLRIALGPLRVRWELHTEFVTWTFMLPMAEPDLATRTPAAAAESVPHGWLAALPGQCLCSLNLWALAGHDDETHALARQLLHEDQLIGSSVAGGLAEVTTDFAIHADGSSRMLLHVGGMSARRLGRLVQRLLEIETYRMAAMLGLPAAQQAGAVLASAEGELAALAEAIRSADRDAEPALLDRLTRLAGQVESQHAATHSRFSASTAYFELVDRRIQDIGETRLAGLQTIAEFMDRRLTPARKTCEWATRRQDALSQRVSRISNLLRTRVEIEQQQSSQALLATMNRRGDLQLKLQSTVEGLSVAAITYYIVGLVSYLAKGAQKLGWPWSPESTAALAIPLVAGTVWWSLRRLHRRVFSH
ncbi:DUF3422 family protein [Pseudorhodoferax sp. Leaf267]|uniref:DUF3422 family protein n=1 Tax=Pseudorhodoferax sp. Leaf267 TaxID=1736316 RepID=UPI0006F3F1BB|nr:DUF3422 domain-containing protein [Pseudorhodoferax sp. Leaf267]KQP14238.1 hypothetical protein ASF43_15560 [Pseudorhodoferax sp. Leaf267]